MVTMMVAALCISLTPDGDVSASHVLNQLFMWHILSVQRTVRTARNQRRYRAVSFLAILIIEQRVPKKLFKIAHSIRRDCLRSLFAPRMRPQGNLCNALRRSKASRTGAITAIFDRQVL